MKKSFLKIGVMGGIALLSVGGFTSCDKSSGGSAVAAVFGFPSSASAVVAGGVFGANIGADGKFDFAITSANPVAGLVAEGDQGSISTAEVRGTGVLTITSGARTTVYSGVTFDFDENSGNGSILRVTDNRSSDADILAELEVLFGAGGALKAEFDAVQAAGENDEVELKALVAAIAGQTTNFIVDINDDGVLFIVRVLSITGDTAVLSGSEIGVNETTNALFIDTSTLVTSVASNLTYAAP